MSADASREISFTLDGDVERQHRAIAPDALERDHMRTHLTPVLRAKSKLHVVLLLDKPRSLFPQIKEVLRGGVDPGKWILVVPLGMFTLEVNNGPKSSLQLLKVGRARTDVMLKRLSDPKIAILEYHNPQ